MKKPLKKRLLFRLRPLNVFVTFGLGAILLIILTSFIIAFTGLREYIPGYADLKTQRRVLYLVQKTDSMEAQLVRGMNTLKISEKSSTEHLQKKSDLKSVLPVSAYDTIHKLHKSVEDSLLRQEIESQDQFSLAVNDNSSLSNSISSFYFFPPLKGTLTNRFDPITKHLE